jgi:hypothetical protein
MWAYLSINPTYTIRSVKSNLKHEMIIKRILMQVYIASTFGRNWPGAKVIFSGFFVHMGMGLCIMWSKYLYSSYSRGVLIIQQGKRQQHCNSKETNEPHFGKWKVRSIFVSFPSFSFQTFLRETNKQTKTLKDIPNPSGFGCQQK